MEYIRLNTVIRPSEEIIDLVIRLSNLPDNKELATFILDDKNYFPHITLYAPEYPEINAGLVYSKVEEVVSSLSKIKLTEGKLALESDGTVTLNFNLSKELLDLRNKVIEELSPVRDGRIREKYQDLDQFNDDEKSEILAYGYPKSRYSFPHISIIHYGDYEEAEKAFEQIRKVINEIPDSSVSQIAVYKAGPQGTCISLEKIFTITI